MKEILEKYYHIDTLEAEVSRDLVRMFTSCWCGLFFLNEAMKSSWLWSCFFKETNPQYVGTVGGAVCL